MGLLLLPCIPGTDMDAHPPGTWTAVIYISAWILDRWSRDRTDNNILKWSMLNRTEPYWTTVLEFVFEFAKSSDAQLTATSPCCNKSTATDADGIRSSWRHAMDAKDSTGTTELRLQQEFLGKMNAVTAAFAPMKSSILWTNIVIGHEVYIHTFIDKYNNLNLYKSI